MKYTIYNYNPKRVLGYENETDFEILNSGMDIKELLEKKYPIIEFEPASFLEFKKHLKIIDWSTEVVGSADALILTKLGSYKPYYLQVESILRLIRLQVNKFAVSKKIAIIGNLDFVVSLSLKLSMNGFSTILSLVPNLDSEKEAEALKKIKSVSFDLNFKFINLEDLSLQDQDIDLFVCNLTDVEISEYNDQLSYFNFLSKDSVIIECTSGGNEQLVLEANNAQKLIYEAKDLNKIKIEYIKEIIKNST